MASVYERITNALSSLGKRRERDNGGQDGSSSSRQPKRFRPWEQSDLHQRLGTFKPLTWFAKPDSVGPVPCAMRGWINDANDSLRCEHCQAKLVYPPNVPYDQRQAAADLFSPSLTTKHTATCPWRQTQCNASLLAYIPSSSNDQLYDLFQALQGKLLKVDLLPDLDAIALQVVRDAAMPYGSYEEMVLGATPSATGTRSGGAAAAAATTPIIRRTPGLRIVDVTDADPAAEPPSGVEPSGALTPTGGAGALTYVLQPSKMTPQQKARLLALLGWDIDVLQPESASGSAALPYTQSAGYSLQHLGVKPRSASKATPPSAATATTAAAGEAASAAAATTTAVASPAKAAAVKPVRERYPMSSVVLKCPHCNSRTGLWNFAGLRPVPTGRLTPAPPATGAAALLTPPAAVAAPGGGGGGGDPLSATIAGGQYGLHGVGGAAAARPFGASSSTPFRFGGAGSTEPVFGIAALDADAQKQTSAAATGFGSPFGGAGARGGAATPASAAAAPPPRHGLTGTKRKAEDQGTPEPMAVDGAGWRTPSGAAAAAADGKRPRLQSQAGGAGAGASPLGRMQTPGGSVDPQQIRELDPVGQHKSWCPWVYTGTREEPQMSGWQHMLRALSSKRQQELDAAAEAAMAAAEAGPTPMDATAPPPTAVDAKGLTDSAVDAIRSL
ncbi:hypothetical protein PLESTB_000563900 [Pleodorina starrii]|uniref:C3HC-type domain-containing protein n=1 Tax=Pleodorina starrii TaxID=330485 RepID=A0A9W6F0B3_9CHLO|nr:hypothetical protein PLESTM_000288900 [Pleodorina starrii]GLC51928.1 hypothetical protein PLESTB_000563900 [Pleodorina starrii]GLC68503.1 hypothetical protein PLESTF_000699400 [Pleodorina starrii]